MDAYEKPKQNNTQTSIKTPHNNANSTKYLCQLSEVVLYTNNNEAYDLYDLPYRGNDTSVSCTTLEHIRKNVNVIPRHHSTESSSSDVSLLSIQSSSSSFHSIRLLCVAFFTIVILFVVAFVIVLIKLQTIEHYWVELEEQVNNFKPGFCVPCKNMMMNTSQGHNTVLPFLDKMIVDDENVCCARNASQTIMLAKLICDRSIEQHDTENVIQLEEQIQNQAINQHRTDKPLVAAHLLANFQITPQSDSESRNVAKFVSSHPTTFIAGLDVTTDMININRTGLYFIYSQIYFTSLYKQGPNETPTQTLYHYVYRYNILYPNGGEELLLKSVRTLCWSENKVYDDNSSYIAAAFKLIAGDKLYIMVSDISAVSRDSETSFFGIVKLS